MYPSYLIHFNRQHDPKTGKFKLSRKVLLPKPERAEKAERPERREKKQQN